MAGINDTIKYLLNGQQNDQQNVPTGTGMSMTEMINSISADQRKQGAYQKNLQNLNITNPQEMTSRQLLGSVSLIRQNDPYTADEIMNNFSYLQTDPNSRFYNPYTKPTNKAVSNLAALGFDTNNLNDAWFNQNNGWIASNLIYNGTTNTPSKPGKKATWDQNVAYELYQWQKSEDATKKAELQWQALQEELAYQANSNKNYSDQYIIDHIDWSKYDELVSMKENKYMQPNEYNRAIGYSDDALYGVLWAARNPEYTGDIYGAMANSALGTGNQYVENPEITAKLDWNSADYSPYSVGMTLNEEGKYYGVYEFNDQQIQRLRDKRDPITGEPLDPDDATAMKMRDNVLKAYDTTAQAKYELDLLKSKLDEKLKNCTDSKTAEDIFNKCYSDGVYDKTTKDYVKLSTLMKMDDSLYDDPDNLVGTTSSVDYRKQDMLAYALGIVEANKNKKTGSEKANETYNLSGSTSVSDVGTRGYHPSTDAEIADEKAKDEKSRDAAETVSKVTTDNEKTFWENAGSCTWGKTFQFFTDFQKQLGTVKNVAAKCGDTSTKQYFTTMMDTMQDIGYYNIIDERNTENKERYAELEQKYGDIEYFQKDFEEQKQIHIGDFNFTLEFKDGTEPGYKIVAGDAPGRNILNLDEIIDYGFNDVIAQAEEQAKAESVEAIKIRNAHKIADVLEETGDKTTQEEIAEYKSLYGQIQLDDQYLNDHKAEYDEKNGQLQARNDSLSIVRTAMEWLGVDTSGIDEAETYLAYLSQFYYEPSLNNSDETKLQVIDRISGNAWTTEQKSDEIHKSIEEINKRMDIIQMTEEYIASNGITLPANVKRNMELTKQDLENEKKAFDYSAILTDTDPKELEAAIAAGKAFEEKYNELEMHYWANLFPNADDFYTLGRQERYLDPDTGDLARDIVTEDDERTYYYLLGKKVLEMGVELDNAIAQIGTNPDVTEAALREAYGDAANYQHFMEDEDSGYGVWSIREFDRSAEWGKELVESGTVGGIIANIMATAISPAESIESICELLDTMLSGDRFNTKSFARRVGAFKEQTRAATRESIDETYKDKPFLKALANFGYEIYCNRGDSLMNSMAFGSLFNVGGRFGDMINEFLGASPMGASAALAAAAQAIDNGASTEQAWLIAGATFFAETLTEAVTLSNIKEAIGTTEKLTKDSLKSIVMDWLTRSGLEEMTGESANNLFENYFNRKAEEWFDNPNFQSDHTKMVAKFLGDGMTNDEAEAAAYEEEIKDLLHTALVSYISASSDVLIATGKATANTVDFYKSATKKLQKKRI